MKLDSKKLSKILKIKLKDENLYIIAFTHRSYLNEHPDYNNPSNERLEFLGDAVLQLISSDYLYQKYSDAPEGDLTNYRAAVVCTSSLAEEAKRLSYGEFLLLSNGEESTGGREREYILANTFEAVLGAMFIENGLLYCSEFVKRELLYKMDNIFNEKSYKDSKSKFQEIAQEKLGITPVYKIVDSWGLDHEKTFKVAVCLDDKEYGLGEGKSKQKAEQQAAESALDKINRL
ncbi:ribonuclease III [candidate division WWE3 bacterium RBG_19FT_COMBO_34_6]|uniref:Ribonuclease 3 n=1 Tax=candidate division WWE3 bacterium RBG_19FT_COMBO_34_6 TaxID=1802612 RepID=A0A1F4UL02_UNCKA|nr:MAG: ribonuclease III [candidate division WWE3 bacterium RBG_19FT_COMBO_34_6]